MSVYVYRRILLTAQTIWFSLLAKLLIGPGKVYKGEGTTTRPWETNPLLFLIPPKFLNMAASYKQLYMYGQNLLNDFKFITENKHNYVNIHSKFFSGIRILIAVEYIGYKKLLKLSSPDDAALGNSLFNYLFKKLLFGHLTIFFILIFSI